MTECEPRMTIICQYCTLNNSFMNQNDDKHFDLLHKLM